jgi:dihydroorotate dehydrogenase electron transfer subunit
MKNNEMRIVKIQRTKKEAERVKTIFFEDELSASSEPGQFLMVWIPGVDEIPLSISSTSGRLASVTVKEIGEATCAINRMRRGDVLGVRGPFGSYFKAQGESALVVGGGIGTAPLLMLVDRLLSEGVETTMIEGARASREILFKDRLAALQKEKGLRVIFTTDDGSFGTKGLATEAAERILSREGFDFIYACGNESMISKLFSLAERHQISMQASLERIMRCAVGICGSCVVGRYRVCRDGPVFSSRQLREIRGELGRFKRGFRGERVPIEE